jgi:Lrp/AsnC family transcriptional regulator for asnA, asnC and gidA
MNLDKLDLKLILELENNSRQTISKISKKIKTSQQLVSYRLAKLKERNIIKKFTTIIDYDLLDFRFYKVYFKLANTNSSKLKEIKDYIKTLKNIDYISECYNNFDLNVDIITHDIVELDKIIKNIRNKFYSQIKNDLILECIKNIHLEKDYLDLKTNYRKINKEIIIENKPKSRKINLCLKKKEILKLIYDNSRLQCVEICRKQNLKPEEVINYYNEFKNKKIILKHNILLNLNKLDIHKYNILFKFKKINLELENNFVTFIKNNENIVEISKVVGPWDFEIKIELKNKDDILEHLRIIKNEFFENIDYIESIYIYNEHKCSFM